MLAIIGTGHLGGNFARAMLRKGVRVKVWNRTAAKASVLQEEGALFCETLEEVVDRSDYIHLILKDDESVNEVIEKASASIKPGAVIFDHTTTSVQGAIDRSAACHSKGFVYIHAPVFMGPQNALEGTGVMMVSGNPEILASYAAHLGSMTGKLINFGDTEGKAAAIKLMGNLFLMAVTAGLSDMLALGKATGINLTDIELLFSEWNPGSSVAGRLHKMTKGDPRQPTWELNMARKDAGLMMSEANEGDSQLTIIPSIAREMDRWIGKGHGNEDWTVIAKDNI